MNPGRDCGILTLAASSTSPVIRDCPPAIAVEARMKHSMPERVKNKFLDGIIDDAAIFRFTD
jgi:hypothetical protein